jgi:flagellar protein FlbD
MIRVTRLNGTPMMVNAELIELIECTPDTLITLTTGNKLNVLEPLDVVLQRVLEYRRSCHPDVRSLTADAADACAAQEN